MGNISEEEYEKACEIVRRYEYQQKPKTVQVTVEYTATVFVTIQVPAEWDIKKIKNELKEGYYGFPLDDEVETDLHNISLLIVDGEEIKFSVSISEIVVGD